MDSNKEHERILSKLEKMNSEDSTKITSKPRTKVMIHLGDDLKKQINTSGSKSIGDESSSD